MNALNKTIIYNDNTQISAERQLAELIDEVRASVGSQASLAAKVSFNPRNTLTKFNNLIEKAIINIKNERDQAVTNKSSQTTIDQLNEQLELIKERSKIFQNYLKEMATGSTLIKTVNCEQSNALSAWLDEVSPLPEVEDLTEMPFQSLKADRTNIPRDFTTENANDINIKTKALKNIDDFFLPEYLASANETEITEDILTKAKELGNSPVKIYEWVRNNVEWQPTWGGQQTADMTLDVRCGNAMDISTLMIALLRAAKIPARYVHGTVDIPVDNFINMAGDFENVDAAMDFVSAGGIPVTSVTVGGKIAKIRIEHVWVEAAVPYYPSRGSKPSSARNPIDSWIPLDGCAKQYEYLSGLDVASITANNDDKFIQDVINSCTINEQEGWIQNFNSNIILQKKNQIQEDLIDYIVDMPNPTHENVIGGRKIINQKFNMLPSNLPYASVVRGVSYTQLASNLQINVTLGLGYDRYMGEYLQQTTLPLYQLNQHSITVSFKPETTTDQKALEALIPNNISDQSQLPNFIPSNIRVISELSLDNKVLLNSSTLALGEEIRIGYKISHPQKVYFDNYYDIIAGSYLALGVVGSNTSIKTFDKLTSNLKETKENLKKNTYTDFIRMSKESLFGNIFGYGVQNYYSQFISQSKIMSIQNKVNFISMPIMGTFGYEPYQKKIFGINRGIEKYGLFMNMYTTSIVQDREGNLDKKIAFMQNIGVMSSILENAIPEQIIQDKIDENNIYGYGFSTAKALAIASSKGQKIYKITPDNQSTILNQLKLDKNAMVEIRAALTTGKYIFTHVEQVSISGYKGSGYIIFDPDTGAAAYKISGGKNGGFLLGALFGAAFISILSLYVISFPMSEAATLMLLPIIAPVVGRIAENIINMYGNMDPNVKLCFISGFVTGMTPITLLAGGLSGLYPFIGKIFNYLGWAVLASNISEDLPSANACLFK